MIDTTERLCTLALLKAPNLGPVLVRKLIQNWGSAQAVLEAKPQLLARLYGMGAKRLEALEGPKLLKLARQELDFAQDQGISLIDFREEAFPQSLLHCHDHPLMLYQKGRLDMAQRRLISIVGTRAATPRGVRFCQQLIEALRPFDPVIVSGLAFGIDIAAHRAALDQGLETVACLAHGLQRLYPARHRREAERIQSQGCLLSEFGYKDPFDRPNFISRNRIIAGLSPATVVVESADKGGSLVTADLAHSYHRDVYAVPGRPEDLYSAGCNRLIANHIAQLIADPQALITQLGWEEQQIKSTTPQTIDWLELDAVQQEILTLLKPGKKSMDELAASSGKPVGLLSGVLFDLELKQLVRQLPGHCFERIQ